MLGLHMRNLYSIGYANTARMLARYSMKIDSESASKDLKALSNEENALILKILSLKEVAYDIPLYGTPRDPHRNSCTTMKDYALKEHTLYCELWRVRNDQKRYLDLANKV